LILLLEGPDGGGKSTIVAKLKEMHQQCKLVLPGASVNFRKMTYREDSKVSRTLDYINESKLYALSVWDRCYYPSDLIYTPLVEGKDSTLLAYKAQIEFEMLLANTVVVFVTASEQALRSRLEVRGDAYVNIKLLNEINYWYVELLQGTALPWHLVNTTCISVEAAVQQVVGIIREHLMKGVGW